uniref:Uncharacterized protein n=1 Tax=Lepeophtheirus salmonis TaxID=72036 RepID=A0A0K2T9P7_LEPSM
MCTRNQKKGKTFIFHILIPHISTSVVKNP